MYKYPSLEFPPNTPRWFIPSSFDAGKDGYYPPPLYRLREWWGTPLFSTALYFAYHIDPGCRQNEGDHIYSYSTILNIVDSCTPGGVAGLMPEVVLPIFNVLKRNKFLFYKLTYNLNRRAVPVAPPYERIGDFNSFGITTRRIPKKMMTELERKVLRKLAGSKRIT